MSTLAEWGLLFQKFVSAVRLLQATWALLVGLAGMVRWAWEKVKSVFDGPHYLSTGDVARRLKCQVWQVQRVCERGLYPEPPRLGGHRLFRKSELPAMRKAL
jgi:hypothetical protein